MSHAALPGIALAFLLTGSKAPLVLLIGAAIAGWVGTLAVMAIVRATRVKFDSALGLVLSVFFGFGLMLLTFIQRRPDASQAGLDKYLFGQAATLVEQDVIDHEHRRGGRAGRAAAALEGVQAAQLRSRLRRQPRLPDAAARRAADDADRDRDRGRVADGRGGADERDDRRPGGGGAAVDGPARGDGAALGRCSGRWRAWSGRR